MPKVSDYTVDGKKHAIHVDDQGRFFTGSIGEETYLQAQTFDLLKKKITNAGRRESVRLALPATYVHSARGWSDDGSYTVRPVIVTGIHHQNRDLLLRAEDGKKESIRTAGSHGDLFKRFTSEQEQTYRGLRDERDASRRAFDKFVERHKYGVKNIEAEVAKAEKAAGVEEEKD